MTDQQRDRYSLICQELDKAKAKLIAVSKTHPKEAVQAFYDLGQRDFGENRVPDLIEKAAALPNDIRWHFIGHLQRNKVKLLIDKVHLIHGIDSERLLLEVNRQATNAGRVVDVLLQFHIAKEESKYGLTNEVAMQILKDNPPAALTGVRIVGVMGMATFTDNDEQIGLEFDRLRFIFNHIKSEFFSETPHFKEISMGMSGDYPLALERGSTMVRVGSLLFGHRNY